MLVLLGRRGWAGSAWWGHLLAGAGGGESVGLGAGVDDVGVEGEPVDDGGGQSGVGEGVAPLAERGVRSAGDGGSFLAGGDDLEEQLGPAGVEVANHGAITIGSTLGKALSLLPYLEYICEIQLRAMATGQPVKVLSPEVLGEALAGFSGYGQQHTKS